MEKADILVKLSDIAAEHFGNPNLQLTSDTVADDVPGWDSIAHIQFLLEIERAMNIRFKSSEAGSFANVGQLADKIQAKLAG